MELDNRFKLISPLVSQHTLLVGHLALLVGVVPGVFCKLTLRGFAQGEAYGHRCSRDQADGHEGPRRHSHPVAAGKLAQLVGSTRWTREDWLALQMTLDVHGQAVGCLISPIAILLQRLDHDPIQVSTQFMQQRLRIGSALISTRSRIAEAAQARTRLRWLLLADDSLDLGERGLPQVERAGAGEQLIQQHTQ